MRQFIDYLKEKEKRVVCIAAGILSVLSVPFVMTNSIFYSAYVEMLGRNEFSLFTTNVFVCMAGFLLLGIALLLNSGNAVRGRKLLSLKDAVKKSDRGSGYLSVSVLSGHTRKLSVYERKCRVVKIIAMIFTVFAAICFIFVFCAGDVMAAADELTKADIDRTESDFRVLSDLFGRLFSYIGIGLASFCCPMIMSNKKVHSALLYVTIGCLAVSSVQLTYFFFGDIFVFPCISDLCILFVECLMIGLCILSLTTEKIKNNLTSVGNKDILEF